MSTMNDVHHFRSSTPSFLISAEPPSQVEQHNKPKSLKVTKEDLWSMGSTVDRLNGQIKWLYVRWARW